MNRISFREKHKLAHHQPIPIEILSRAIDSAHFSGRYHYHDYLELIYCVEGQMELKTFHGSALLSSDEMVLISAEEPHGIAYLTPSSRHYCIKFLKELLSPFYDGDAVHYLRLSSALSRLRPFLYIPADRVAGDGERDIKALFARAARAYEQGTASDTLTVYASILEIVSLIMAEPGSADSINIRLIQSKQPLLRRIRSYMEDNYQDASLAGLAEACALNYSYFSTLFKELYGESFRSYLISYRIDRSIPLLCETDMDIATVAQTVGFSTASQYIKMFKRAKNISPGKFRQLTRSKNI